MRSTPTVTLTFLFVLAACLEPTPGPKNICAQQSSESVNGYQVAVCDAAYDEAPLVRPPDDSESGGVKKMYGGIQARTFVGRGVSIDVAGASWLDAELSSNRHGYFLYAADVRAGVVEKVTPVARIDDRVFGRLMVGKTLEGVAAARIPDGGSQPYEYLSRTVPMRIRFDDALPATASDSDTQFPRYALGGSIENMDGGVRASDGGCFPALSTLGERNPMFSAADARVSFRRHPNMHGGGDDVFTLDWPQGISAGNNMGGGLFIPVSALIQPNAPAPTEAHSAPHGVPWGGPSTDFSVVSGGGASCTP